MEFENRYNKDKKANICLIVHEPFTHKRSNSCSLSKKATDTKFHLRIFIHLKHLTSNSRFKMLKNNFERSDRMAVKRLNAMGIEARSWYDKGKESKSDMSSQVNWNQGKEISKQHGNLAKSSSCSLQ